MNRPIICLPFAGFYESIYSGEIDHCAEMQVYNEVEREGELASELRLDEREIADILFDVTDYSSAYLDIAREFVTSFDVFVSDELGVPLRLKMEKMESPREYNFATDRVFAFTTWKALDALRRMSKADGHATLAALIAKRFTSRSGFMSFYPNDLASWLAKPFRTWDHNELQTLLMACCKIKGLDRDTIEDAMLDSLRNAGDFDTAYEGAVDWPKFEERRDALRADKVQEQLELDPDYVAPPVRCAFTLDLFTDYKPSAS